jgi:hypothetical protein
MKVTITLNGVKETIEIPTSWGQVKFGEFMKVTKAGGDFVEVLAVFTKTDAETLRKALIVNLDLVIAAFGFMKSPIQPVFNHKILGYDVPKDLGFETVGQFADAKKAIEGTKDCESYPLICAIYACKSKHGVYDWEKAEAMKDEFMNAPAVEVLAIGNFTLMKLAALIQSTGIPSQKANTRLKKYRLVLKGWLMRMAFMVRFYIWKKKQALKGLN